MSIRPFIDLFIMILCFFYFLIRNTLADDSESTFPGQTPDIIDEVFPEHHMEDLEYYNQNQNLHAPSVATENLEASYTLVTNEQIIGFSPQSGSEYGGYTVIVFLKDAWAGEIFFRFDEKTVLGAIDEYGRLMCIAPPLTKGKIELSISSNEQEWVHVGYINITASTSAFLTALFIFVIIVALYFVYSFIRKMAHKMHRKKKSGSGIYNQLRMTSSGDGQPETTTKKRKRQAAQMA